MDNKELLKQWGESTAYSTKGHFKTADLRRILIHIYVVVNLLFSVISISDLFSNDLMKILSVISLAASIMLLIIENRGGMGICNNHFKAGNEYLELHNDIYTEFVKPTTTASSIEKLKNRLNDLNKSPRPHISTVAKAWAKYSIQTQKEMTNWWI